MIPEEKQYKYIKKDKHTALRLIREQAIIKFFKRFSGQRLKGSRRKRVRQIERWLDSTNTNIAFDKDKLNFAVYNTEIISALVVRITENLEKKRYEYEYTIERIPDLTPEFAFFGARS